MLNEKLADKPGPGQYKTPGEIVPTGSYFVSKFKSSVGKTFGLSLKKSSSNAAMPPSNKTVIQNH